MTGGASIGSTRPAHAARGAARANEAVVSTIEPAGASIDCPAATWNS